MDRKETNSLEIERKEEGKVGKTWKQKSKRKKSNNSNNNSNNKTLTKPSLTPA